MTRKRKEPQTLEDSMLELAEQFRVVWHVTLDIYEDVMTPLLNAMAMYIGLRQLAKRTPRDALYDTLLWMRTNSTDRNQ